MTTTNSPGLAGFGYRLKAARKALEAHRVTERVTQSAIGAVLGLSEAAYGHWEKGRALPDLKTVVELSALLGVRPAWLAFGDGEREAGEATFGQIKVTGVSVEATSRARKLTERDAVKRTKKRPLKKGRGGAA
jgi:transcriptional regulator with XRE-family HTH domain